jgi:hypothetical protein
VNSDPPSSLSGAGGVFQIGAFVINESYTSSAPTFWWSVGGHDPIYAIYVPESIVSPPGDAWDGYHFMAPTGADAILPFPVNLFAHDWLPWTISLVQDDALTLPAEGTLHRDDCDNGAALSFCGAVLDDFDEATESASHELVEAASDPYPFFAWFDPTKFPPWTAGEISDICEEATPWGDSTVVGSTSVSTYWSNSDNACVPASLPSITITSPSDGAVVTWQAGGAEEFVSAVTSDPISGTITPVFWSVDGGPPQAVSFVTGLSLGAHTITATATDVENHSVSASVHVTVVAQAPTATILAPASGATITAGLVALRGAGSDPQDGTLPDSALSWSVDGVSAGTGQVAAATVTVGDHVVTLTVKDSAGLTGTAASVVHVVASNGLPTVVITSPANNDGETDPSVPVTFTCAAVDGSGNPIPNANISWTDDITGFLGTGATIRATLSGTKTTVDFHHITVTATDAQGNRATDTITYWTGQIT